MRPKKYKGGGRRSLYDMMKKGGMLRKADRKEARALKLDEKANNLRTGARDKRDRLIGRADKNYGKAMDLRKRSLMMALGGLVKKYQNGGVEGDPPMTAEERKAALQAQVMADIQEANSRVEASSGRGGDGTDVFMPDQGYIDSLRPEPVQEQEPVPVRDPEPREDLEPLTPLGMRTIKRGDKKELQKTTSLEAPTPRRGEVQFEKTLSGSNKFLKTGKVPIYVNVYDEESKRFRIIQQPLSLLLNI